MQGRPPVICLLVVFVVVGNLQREVAGGLEGHDAHLEVRRGILGAYGEGGAVEGVLRSRGAGLSIPGPVVLARAGGHVVLAHGIGVVPFIYHPAYGQPGTSSDLSQRQEGTRDGEKSRELGAVPVHFTVHE